MSAEKEFINIKLKDGEVKIELRSDLAPKHVERIKKLVSEKKYDNVVFHRVIEGFMAQTGDVQYGNAKNSEYNLSRVGTGGSEYKDLPSEFSNEKHLRGAVSMARAQDPNSANSQFFICFADCTILDGQYTIWGQVVNGMDFVDNIKKGKGSNGQVENPDRILKMSLIQE